MSDLREIYQQVVLDHYKKPRNFRKIDQPTHFANGSNPLCGDKIQVYLILENGIVKDLSFEGSGCAICTASSSMMTQSLIGKTEAEADAIFNRFHALLTEENLDVDGDGGLDLGKLKAFAGVREFPVRVKCATLAWHTFHAALHRQAKEVSTE